MIVDVGEAAAAAPARSRPTLAALQRLSSRLELQVILDGAGYPVRLVVRLPVGDVVVELWDFGIELPEIARSEGGG